MDDTNDLHAIRKHSIEDQIRIFRDASQFMAEVFTLSAGTWIRREFSQAFINS